MDRIETEMPWDRAPIHVPTPLRNAATTVVPMINATRPQNQRWRLTGDARSASIRRDLDHRDAQFAEAPILESLSGEPAIQVVDDKGSNSKG